MEYPKSNPTPEIPPVPVQYYRMEKQLAAIKRVMITYLTGLDEEELYHVRNLVEAICAEAGWTYTPPQAARID